MERNYKEISEKIKEILFNELENEECVIISHEGIEVCTSYMDITIPYGKELLKYNMDGDFAGAFKITPDEVKRINGYKALINAKRVNEAIDKYFN